MTTWLSTLIAFVVVAASVAGCGGAGSEGSPNGRLASTEDRDEPAALATVSLSPDLVIKGEELPTSVVCQDNPTWLPISWKGLPSATGEIVIEVSALGPVENLSPGQRAYSAEDVYAIGGISPSADHLGESLPDGAYVVLSEPGAPICPPLRRGQRFSFTLYALPRGSTFRELMEASSSLEELWTELSKRIVGLGGLSVRYPGDAAPGA
jgi:hypothetical protein